VAQRSSCRACSEAPRRAGRAPRLFGWLAAASLLVHGWVPILVQVSLLASEPVGHGHVHVAGRADRAAAPGAAPSGKSPECPLFHGTICLCATFAKLLPAPGAPAVARAPALAARRRRRPRGRPPRQGRRLLFDARAPPASA
jgi:hypothetical protein